MRTYPLPAYGPTEVPPEFGYCKSCSDAATYVVTWTEVGDDWAEERGARVCSRHAARLVLDPANENYTVKLLARDQWCPWCGQAADGHDDGQCGEIGGL